MKNEKAVLMRFNLLQVLYWCGLAAMGSFVSAFMISKGMSNTRLSIMLALYMLCAFVGQFFWGSLSDKKQTNKKFFILNEIFVLVIYYLIYIFSDNFLLVNIFYPLLGFVIVPQASNLDSWILKCFAHRPQVYGPARGWASAGFAVFMLVYGNLINSWGYHIMPWFATVIVGGAILVAFLQPDSPVVEGSSRGGIKLKDIGALAKSPIYMYIIVLMLFIGLTMSPVSNMKIVVLESVGGNVSHQGIDSFFLCFFQLPFFFLSGLIRRIPQRTRILLGSCGSLIMSILDLLATSPVMVIAGSVFHGIGYSILLPTVREIVEQKVDPAIKTTAHGVCDAVYASLAGIVSLLYVGGLIDAAGTTPVFIISICTGSVALLLGITYFIKTLRNLRAG